MQQKKFSNEYSSVYDTIDAWPKNPLFKISRTPEQKKRIPQCNNYLNTLNATTKKHKLPIPALLRMVTIHNFITYHQPSLG